MEDETKTMECSRPAKTREDARKIARRLRMVRASNVEIKGQRGSWLVSATVEPARFAKFCAGEAKLAQEHA